MSCHRCQRCSMIRAILASAILWPLYIGMSLVLQVLGLAILLPLSAGRLWTMRWSMVYDLDKQSRAGRWDAPYRAARPVDVWRGGWLTWLWGNEEDGVTGPLWWEQRTGALWTDATWWCRAWSAYRWSALRNPVNNLRFVPLLNPVIEPARIQHWQRAIGYSDWVFTWQGAYAGIRANISTKLGGHVYRFWLGWKLKPEDAKGVADTDMRKPRCGFAMQFKRIG